MNKDDENTLKKDLGRTGIKYENSNVLDHCQNPVYNIVKAVVNYDKDTGYCQGMGVIAAMLHKTLKNEEDAFYCFVHIMKRHQWNKCFCTGFPKV
jgi:hypothetical protein